MPTFYQLERQLENRVDSAALLQLMRATHDDVAALRESLTIHMTSESKALTEAIASLTETAFPGGDAQGHREYHLSMMEAAKNRAEFWRKLLFELTKWGLLGFLTWLVADLVKAHFK